MKGNNCRSEDRTRKLEDNTVQMSLEMRKNRERWASKDEQDAARDLKEAARDSKDNETQARLMNLEENSHKILMVAGGNMKADFTQHAFAMRAVLDDKQSTSQNWEKKAELDLAFREELAKFNETTSIRHSKARVFDWDFVKLLRSAMFNETKTGHNVALWEKVLLYIYPELPVTEMAAKAEDSFGAMDHEPTFRPISHHI